MLGTISLLPVFSRSMLRQSLHSGHNHPDGVNLLKMRSNFVRDSDMGLVFLSCFTSLGFELQGGDTAKGGKHCDRAYIFVMWEGQ